jgi:hypothetical protein
MITDFAQPGLDTHKGTSSQSQAAYIVINDNSLDYY